MTTPRFADSYYSGWRREGQKLEDTATGAVAAQTFPLAETTTAELTLFRAFLAVDQPGNGPPTQPYIGAGGFVVQTTPEDGSVPIEQEIRPNSMALFPAGRHRISWVNEEGTSLVHPVPAPYLEWGPSRGTEMNLGRERIGTGTLRGTGAFVFTPVPERATHCQVQADGSVFLGTMAQFVSAFEDPDASWDIIPNRPDIYWPVPPGGRFLSWNHATTNLRVWWYT